MKKTITKLFNRNPLGLVLVRNAESLNPRFIAKANMDTLVKKINHILTHLHKVKYLSSAEADKAKSEYSSFIAEMKGT